MITLTSPRWARISPLVLFAASTCIALSIGADAEAATPTVRGLNAAARRSTRADHQLVTAAKRLKACTNAHPARPRRCASERAAVQSSGRRLARSERRLALLARESCQGPRRRGLVGSARRSYPSAARKRLYLERIWLDQLGQYVLAPARALGTGLKPRSTRSCGARRRRLPPPVPGVTVELRVVRTDVNGSAWSTQRSIALSVCQTGTAGIDAAEHT